MNLTPLDNPKQWVSLPYNKDCSHGICTLYCPQWCYTIPPPPPFIEFSDDNSGPSFSPLIISIIGILASACLLVSYYVILTKYCRDRASSTRRLNQNMEFRDIHEDSRQEPFFVASNGLDEAMIKSITIFKYKKSDDGSCDLVLQKDCSICLSEFEENECLRLLPKCCHAFHVPCIDTWFKSHSNCPLCRANIVSADNTPPCVLPIDSPPVENVGMVEISIRVEEDGLRNVAHKTSYRGSGSGEQVIDIRDDEPSFNQVRSN